jgi:tetratricopeptide (TPR) repeat protein
VPANGDLRIVALIKRILLNRKVWFIYLILPIFIVGIYLNSFKNDFVNWDDPGLILKNKRIQSLDFENVKEMFTPRKFSTFQPLRMFSYAIDYSIWKLNPMGYRITNILFYILTCMTVFFTLRVLSASLREGKQPDSHFRVGLFGALLFAAHPVHVEAVTWLAARKEVLQGFFFFFAFYLYLKGREGEGRRRVSYFSFAIFSVLLATLSKPSAVVFPGVIILYEIARRKEGLIKMLKRHWIFLGLCLAVSVIFTFILMKVMLEAGGIKAYRGGSFLSNLLASLYAFFHNIKLLTSTINYSAAYTFSVSLPVFCLKNVVIMLISLLLFVGSVISLRKTKIIFFSLFFFVITLLPYLNIIPISTGLADRYVFIASFSYVFILGILFDRLYIFRQERFSEGFFKLLSVTLFLFLLTGYSFMTIRQNKIWENSYTLWADAVEKYPESSTANALMGVVYMELGMNEKAIEYLEKAVQILPYDYLSRNNLGIVYDRLEQPEKALRELMTAMRLNPKDDVIKINLSLFYLRQKEYLKAVEILKFLLSKDGQNANLHFRLGMTYKEMGNYEASISELIKCSELDPHIINPYEELGNLYLSKMKDVEKAIYYYLKGIESGSPAKSRIEDLRWMIQDLECHR